MFSLSKRDTRDKQAVKMQGKRSDGGALHCSFCCKSQHEIRQLFAGHDAFICNECVSVCVNILIGESKLPGNTKRNTA